MVSGCLSEVESTGLGDTLNVKCEGGEESVVVPCFLV